jgi:hypothetical protein
LKGLRWMAGSGPQLAGSCGKLQARCGEVKATGGFWRFVVHRLREKSVAVEAPMPDHARKGRRCVEIALSFNRLRCMRAPRAGQVLSCWPENRRRARLLTEVCDPRRARTLTPWAPLAAN